MTRTQRFGLFVRGAVFLGAVATLLVATPMAAAQSGAGPDGMQIDQTTGSDRTGGGGGVIPTLFYGPIPGFTTAAYSASETIAAPLGSLIPFHIEGLKEGQTVAWTGAESVSRDGLTATCLVNSTGPIFVTATIYPDQVDLVCELDVIAVTPGGLTFDLAAPTASVFTHKRPTNSELVALYHNPESLAAFVVARDGSASTAVKRTLLAIPNDPKFSISSGELTTDLLSSLIEWRVDGKAVGVGSNFFETKGVRQIEVGPPGHATIFELTSYDVHLNSPDVVNGIIPTDRPITFTATTDPPGFEKNLRWIAATKIGSTTPSTGAGDSFSTTFQNALGDGTSIVDSPWFGVKVGNVGVGQDPPVIVANVSPTTGVEGDIITINGFGFDTNPLNSCVFLGTSARAQVLTATSTQLTAVIGPVASALTGPVTVITGLGANVPDGSTPFTGGTADFTNAFLLTNGQSANTLLGVDFQLLAPAPSIDAASVANNEMTVTLTGDWADGDMAIVDLHLLCDNWEWVEIVFKVTFVIPGGTAPLAECAAAIAAIINSSNFPCSATSAGGTITITKTGGIAGGFGSVSR